jgi:hypothetical protein
VPSVIVADTAMWAEGEERRRHAIRSDAERFQAGLDSVLRGQAPRLVRAVKGGGSRQRRVRDFHRSIQYVEIDVMDEETGEIRREVPEYGRPRLTVDPSCSTFLRTVPALPVSPMDADDVDTNANDHAFDGWTYLSSSTRVEHSEEPGVARDFGIASREALYREAMGWSEDEVGNDDGDTYQRRWARTA